MKPVRLLVSLPEIDKELSLRVFGDELSFIVHCASHILNATDCWKVFLDEDLIERARTDIRGTSSEVERSFANGSLGRLYREVAGVIDRALKDAVSTPRYLVFRAKNRKIEYKFLASDGMMVLASQGRIRTAFVAAAIGYSRSVWPEMSWMKLVRTIRQWEYSSGEEVLRVTKENWAEPPGVEWSRGSSQAGKVIGKALERKQKPDPGGFR